MRKNVYSVFVFHSKSSLCVLNVFASDLCTSVLFIYKRVAVYIKYVKQVMAGIASICNVHSYLKSSE